MKIFRMKRLILKVDQNENGTLAITREYYSTLKMDSWEKDGRPYRDAEQLINANGGVEPFLAKCQDVYIDQYINELNTEKRTIRERANTERMNQVTGEIEKAKKAYDAAFSQEVTESTPENIFILLRYLNTVNWGVWNLPKMTIGYQCAQHDCGGKTATTIKLDSPIKYWDEPETMFVYGNPHGYLQKYTQIG